MPGGRNGHGDHVESVGLKASVATHLSEIDAREVNSIPLGNGSDGEAIVARVGRYGPYLQRGEDRASIPDDMAPDELTIERAEEILAAPSNDRVLGVDPSSGLDVQVKAGRFGPYVQVGDVVEGGDKPRTASLFSSMDQATLTLEQALELLRIHGPWGRIPRRARTSSPTTGGSARTSSAADTRSLGSGPVADRHPPRGTGTVRAAQATPGAGIGGTLRELGTDPTTTLPVVVKDGRFGPYVTDGTTNASLRKGDVVDSIDIERASELLAERRAAGPRRARRRRPRRRRRPEEGHSQAGRSQKGHGEEEPREEAIRGQEGARCEEGGDGVRTGRPRCCDEGCADRTVLRCRPGVA